jgi:cytochrome c
VGVARVLPLLFLLFLLAVFGIAITQDEGQMQTSDELAPEILEVIAGYGEQVRHGAEVYDLVCSNCHGNTGLGIEEGRAEFSPEHQRCEKCHRPNNAARLVDVEISERNSFNIGTPPALKTLAKFGSAAGLKAYIQAAMPRHNPGQLSNQEYLDITAFLVALNKKLPENSPLTAENLETVLLVD